MSELEDCINENFDGLIDSSIQWVKEYYSSYEKNIDDEAEDIEDVLSDIYFHEDIPSSFDNNYTENFGQPVIQCGDLTIDGNGGIKKHSGLSVVWINVEKNKLFTINEHGEEVELLVTTDKNGVEVARLLSLDESKDEKIRDLERQIQKLSEDMRRFQSYNRFNILDLEQ